MRLVRPVGVPRDIIGCVVSPSTRRMYAGSQLAQPPKWIHNHEHDKRMDKNLEEEGKWHYPLDNLFLVASAGISTGDACAL